MTKEEQIFKLNNLNTKLLDFLGESRSYLEFKYDEDLVKFHMYIVDYTMIINKKITQILKTVE